jgi:hypothetical protein
MLMYVLLSNKQFPDSTTVFLYFEHSRFHHGLDFDLHICTNYAEQKLVK